jgi:hypothetical protein
MAASDPNHQTSSLQEATSLLESSPLRLFPRQNDAAREATENPPVATQSELEKELELAVKREEAAASDRDAKAAGTSSRKNYATLNNGVYYWSMPSVLLDYLHKNDPVLGERAVAAQKAYARFKTYETRDPSPADIETLINFGSRLQDVYYCVESAAPVAREHRSVLKDTLECTAGLYKEAHDVGIIVNSSNATLGKILFSWAVVLSDLARLVEVAGGGNEEKLEYAVASCLKVRFSLLLRRSLVRSFARTLVRSHVSHVSHVPTSRSFVCSTLGW